VPAGRPLPETPVKPEGENTAFEAAAQSSFLLP
jgi:hypothetical protein